MSQEVTHRDLRDDTQGDALHIIEQFSLSRRDERLARPQQGGVVFTRTECANDGGERQTPAKKKSTTHSHSGRRPSWARISLMARPVCSVSSSANAEMCSSSARARRVRTLDRWRAGERDQTPDSKTEWAPSTACWTSSGPAASTLHNL